MNCDAWWLIATTGDGRENVYWLDLWLALDLDNDDTNYLMTIGEVLKHNPDSHPGPTYKTIATVFNPAWPEPRSWLPCHFFAHREISHCASLVFKLGNDVNQTRAPSGIGWGSKNTDSLARGITFAVAGWLRQGVRILIYCACTLCRSERRRIKGRNLIGFAERLLIDRGELGHANHNWQVRPARKRNRYIFLTDRLMGWWRLKRNDFMRW